MALSRTSRGLLADWPCSDLAVVRAGPAGLRGGVDLISMAQLNAGYVSGRGYLGWSDPVCRGATLPAGTVHPVPSGR